MSKSECSILGCYEPVSADELCEECHAELICVGEDENGDPCGERNDDGEGYGGYCGNCADRLESEGHWE
jgi:hypothetical protein